MAVAAVGQSNLVHILGDPSVFTLSFNLAERRSQAELDALKYPYEEAFQHMGEFNEPDAGDYKDWEMKSITEPMLKRAYKLDAFQVAMRHEDDCDVNASLLTMIREREACNSTYEHKHNAKVLDKGEKTTIENTLIPVDTACDKGLYATADIQEGAFILSNCDITVHDTSRLSDTELAKFEDKYDLQCHALESQGSPLKFCPASASGLFSLNDFHGLATGPNCAIIEKTSAKTGRSLISFHLLATKNIKDGEQCLVDYGAQYDWTGTPAFGKCKMLAELKGECLFFSTQHIVTS